MYRIRDTRELLSLLNKNKKFIAAAFESSQYKIDINNTLGFVDEDELDNLENNEIVEVFQNDVLLSEHLVKFLESSLADGFDEELYDYKNIFTKVDNFIKLYYQVKEQNGDADSYVSKIQRILRRIPSNLLSSFKGMKYHIEFTYRSAATSEAKVQEMIDYKRMFDELCLTLEYVQKELKKNHGFFLYAGSEHLMQQEVYINKYILEIRDSIIKTNHDIIAYIKDTEKNVKFYKHITELKELNNRRELRERTNFYELVSASDREPVLSGFSKSLKKDREIKLYPDFAYDEEFEKRYESLKIKTSITKKIEASTESIEDVFFKDESISIVDYNTHLYSYLDDESAERSFLEYLREKEPKLSEPKLLQVYLSIVILNADALYFTENYEKIGKHECISVYPPTKNQGNPYAN